MRTYGTSPLLLLAMLLWSGSARAGTSYDNCTGFITAPTTITLLPGTRSASRRTKVRYGSVRNRYHVINADNVTIDCNDFPLGGPGPSNAEKAHSESLPSTGTTSPCGIATWWVGITRAFPSRVRRAAGTLSSRTNRLSGQTNSGIVVAGTKLIVRRNVITVTTPVDFTRSGHRHRGQRIERHLGRDGRCKRQHDPRRLVDLYIRASDRHRCHRSHQGLHQGQPDPEAVERRSSGLSDRDPRPVDDEPGDPRQRHLRWQWPDRVRNGHLLRYGEYWSRHQQRDRGLPVPGSPAVAMRAGTMCRHDRASGPGFDPGRSGVDPATRASKGPRL